MASYVLPFAESTIPKGGEFGNKAAPRTNAHRGVDFSVAGGAAIKSISDGKVVKNTWSTVLGWVVVVEDSKGIFWGYCHMREASKLTLGTKVYAGKSVIGRVGNTGSASRGAHLHLTCGSDIEAVFSGWVQDPIACAKRLNAKEKPVAKVVEKPAVEAEAEEAKPVAAKSVPTNLKKKVK